MTKTIYLAGGCFWGLQKYLKLISGVIETEVGFANGNTDQSELVRIRKKCKQES